MKKILLLFIIICSCTSKEKSVSIKADTLKFASNDLLSQTKRSDADTSKINLKNELFHQSIVTFNPLDTLITHASYFGYDGGNAKIYLKDRKEVFALIPHSDSDSILCFVAIDSSFQTINHISTQNTVHDLLKIYPKMTLQLNLISMHEEFSDTINHLSFAFKTSENHTIGEYETADSESIPVHDLTHKIDYIIMK